MTRSWRMSAICCTSARVGGSEMVRLGTAKPLMLPAVCVATWLSIVELTSTRALLRLSAAMEPVSSMAWLRAASWPRNSAELTGELLAGKVGSNGIVRAKLNADLRPHKHYGAREERQ